MERTPIHPDNLAETLHQAWAVGGSRVGHIIAMRSPTLAWAFCWHRTQDECEAHAQQCAQAEQGMG